MGPMFFVLLAAACGSSSKTAAPAAGPPAAGKQAPGHDECEMVVGCLKDINMGEEPTADEIAETRQECNARLDAASPELLEAIRQCAGSTGACDGVADCTMMTDPSEYQPEAYENDL
jgi:hypothetical protein